MLAAIAVLLVSGCGGSSSRHPAGFKTEFAAATRQFKAVSHAIGGAIQHARSLTDAQLSSTFQGLAVRWQAPLGRLHRLRPPSSVAGQFSKLVGSATRVEADLNAIVAAAQTHNASAAKQAAAGLVTDILSAKSTSIAIRHRLGIA